MSASDPARGAGSGADSAAGRRATPPHAWDVSPKQAVELQRRFATEVVVEDRFGPIRRVAGVDVGFEPIPGLGPKPKGRGFQRGRTITRAAVAVLSFPELELVDQAVVRQLTTFPYVPGLLSFREIPAVLRALDELVEPPDLILADGQGIAHPRRFGFAAHLGWWLDRPTIGVAKSRLVGEHEEPGPEKGDRAPLLHDGEVIGAALRTRRGCKPLFVSPGHRVGLDSAVLLTLACTPRYRLPETTRQAHRLASGPE